MKRVNVNKLGFFLDGWSELIDGRGETAEDVREYVVNQLEDREMPEVDTEAMTGYVKMGEADRPYLASSRSPGVTSTVYVNAYGEDLYVSWKTFQKVTLNWRRIGLLALLSLLIAFLIPYLSRGILIELIVGIILWILWLAFFLAALVGLPYGAWRLYQKIKVTPAFLQRVGLTPTLDKVFTGGSIVAGLLGVLILVNIIPPPQGVFLPTVGDLIRGTLWIFLVVVIIGFFAGVLRHGHPLAYFLTIPNIFDADDAIALSLSVHKTVLHALDKAGIDTTALHSRASSTKGRMAEEI